MKEIVSCNITITNPDKAESILKEYGWDDILSVKDSSLIPKKWYIELSEDEFPLLLALSRIAYGNITFGIEDYGEHTAWTIELKDGKITIGGTKISLPAEVARRKVIENMRYTAAVACNVFAVYDKMSCYASNASVRQTG